ncbi:hypothetical protein [Prevotella sp. P3-122]|uniref:hypothetical protein n=1 Tax=Prevotella sp. P3-122 TaxID=2024223 RepID=UPI000B973F41|nr:hypothetical protein [Prevotella sp. P3-122]OYP60432.1 hypothetical protein CIL02_08315 [Prevotella sp. P3-122]
MDKEVKFTIRMTVDGSQKIVTATADINKFAEEIEKARTLSTRLRDELVKSVQTGELLKNALSGLEQVRGYLLELTAASAQQSEAETKLANNMRNTMGARDEEIASIKALCAAQQELGVIGDEVQLAGAQELATYLEEKSSLEKLIPVMNDMVAQQYGLSATQENAANIATMLGKVMDGQTEALSRYGYKFDEAQAQILKFGTEEQRAAVLAEVVESAVGGMNAELGRTEAGKAKQAANDLGDLKEAIGSMLVPLESMLLKAGEMTVALNAIGTTIVGIKGLAVAIKNTNIVVLAHSAATKASALAHALWSKQLYYGKAASIAWAFGAKVATVQAIAMRTAILGLMAVSGVGIAIAAVSGVISLFSSNTDDATESMSKARKESERLKEVEDSASQAYTNAASSLSVNMGKLEELISKKKKGVDTTAEEKKIVEELNGTYGATMGYFSDVSQWYIALVANSEAYCKQMMLEAKTRILANQIAEKELELHDIRYDKKGNLKRYRKNGEKKLVITGADANGKPIYEYKEQESDLEKANKKLREGYAELKHLKNQIKDAAKSTAQIDFKVKGSTTMPGSGGTEKSGKSGNELKLIENATTYKELANNVAYYQQQLEQADVSDSEHIITLTRQKKAAEDAVATFKALLDAAGRPVSLDSLEDIDKELQYQQRLRQKATADNIAGIDSEIKRLNALKTAIEDSSYAGKDTGTIKTYEELAQQQAYYERRLRTATETERTEIQKRINALEQLKRKWDGALAELEKPGDIGTLDTMEKLDDAIAYYTDRQKKASTEEVTAIQRTIDKLQDKRNALARLTELTRQQRELADIGSLEGTELKLRLELIGLDGVKSKIRSLQEMLDDTENPLSGDERKEVEKLLKSWQGYEKVMKRNSVSVKDTWGHVKGVGSSVEGITDALSGNGRAWERVTGVVDGLIGMWESVKGIIGIVDALTGAVRVQESATISSAAAKQMETTAVVENTAAKSGEAIADATSSGAKLPFPANIAAIAAGVAAVVAALGMIGGAFADGGIVGGSSWRGDRLLVRVNSGEMILNARQQAELFALANGSAMYGGASAVVPQWSGMMSLIGGRPLVQMPDMAVASSPRSVVLKAKGRDLVGVISNERRLTRKRILG